ncbi:hypothetical protein ACFL35_03940 [Candidatus Riflebacteria bacterium]
MKVRMEISYNKNTFDEVKYHFFPDGEPEPGKMAEIIGQILECGWEHIKEKKGIKISQGELQNRQSRLRLSNFKSKAKIY